MASRGSFRAFTALQDSPPSTDAPQATAAASPTSRRKTLQQTPQTKKTPSNLTSDNASEDDEQSGAAANEGGRCAPTGSFKAATIAACALVFVLVIVL